MSTPLVSIVMAAKNYAKFLPQAVESAFAQTYPHWELIIIDDGSTDDTPLAVEPFLVDHRVQYHRSDKLGQSRAKNLGYDFCHGDFIAYLDADDAWLPEKIERQLEVFQKSPQVGVCYTRRLLMNDQGQVQPPLPRKSLPSGETLSAMFLQNFVCFSSVMVRKIVFEHVGVFSPKLDLAIDYDLWLRVARHYEFAGVDAELVLYRTGHGNLSKKLVDRVDTANAIMTKQLRRDPELPKAVIAEGFASTARTLAYVMRPSERLTALRWYWRALRWPNRRLETLKGIAGTLWHALRKPRQSGSPENASVNL